MASAITLHRPARRNLLLLTLALLLGLSATISTIAAGAARAAERPTIVLVHGAWADPAGWAQVQAGLEKDGFAVVAPRLDLLGIQSDADIVRATLDAIPGDKILVGHSYGGVVISNASYGRSDVQALVYTAAFVPDQGDSIISLTHDFNPPAVLPHLVWTGEPFASLCFIDSAFFRPLFAADLSPKKAEALNAGQQASSVVLLVEGSGPVGWHSIPSWYAVSARDFVIDPDAQRWMAARAGATVVEFDDASHAGGYTHYSTRFVKLIEEAVLSTSD